MPYPVGQTAGSKRGLSNSAILSPPTSHTEKKIAVEWLEIPAPPSDPAKQQVSSKRGLSESAFMGTVNVNGRKKRVIPDNTKLASPEEAEMKATDTEDDSSSDKVGGVEVSMVAEQSPETSALDPIVEKTGMVADDSVPDNASIASSVSRAASTESGNDHENHDADNEV